MRCFRKRTIVFIVLIIHRKYDKNIREKDFFWDKYLSKYCKNTKEFGAVTTNLIDKKTIHKARNHKKNNIITKRDCVIVVI